ncbi:hypothetical protein AHAS_Ahas07G0156700 [Arachis hypogaea]
MSFLEYNMPFSPNSKRPRHTKTQSQRQTQRLTQLCPPPRALFRECQTRRSNLHPLTSLEESLEASPNPHSSLFPLWDLQNLHQISLHPCHPPRQLL